MNVDWAKIRGEYASGGGSYRALAQKHGVPLGTLKRRAAAEKWREGTSRGGRAPDAPFPSAGGQGGPLPRVVAKAARYLDLRMDALAQGEGNTGEVRLIVATAKMLAEISRREPGPDAQDVTIVDDIDGEDGHE